MTPVNTTKLGFIIQKTYIIIQKINSLALIIYEIVIKSFLLLKKVIKL